MVRLKEILEEIYSQKMVLLILQPELHQLELKLQEEQAVQEAQAQEVQIRRLNLQALEDMKGLQEFTTVSLADQALDRAVQVLDLQEAQALLQEVATDLQANLRVEAIKALHLQADQVAQATDLLQVDQAAAHLHQEEALEEEENRKYI